MIYTKHIHREYICRMSKIVADDPGTFQIYIYNWLFFTDTHICERKIL